MLFRKVFIEISLILGLLFVNIRDLIISELLQLTFSFVNSVYGWYRRIVSIRVDIVIIFEQVLFLIGLLQLSNILLYIFVKNPVIDNLFILLYYLLQRLFQFRIFYCISLFSRFLYIFYILLMGKFVLVLKLYNLLGFFKQLIT